MALNKQNLSEVNGVHVDSPEFLITTGIHNRCQHYFLTENQELLSQWPMVYIDYRERDKVYRDKNTAMHHFQEIDGEEGTHGFSVSKLDSKNKYSLDYYNCTGVIAIWRSIETWENISILTHQDPAFFLSEDEVEWSSWESCKQYFKDVLTYDLENLRDECEPGTIDIIILGGNNNDNFQEYKDSISLLSEWVEKTMWFSPVVVWWPSNEDDLDEKWIYVDTKNRRVYYYKEYSDIDSNVVWVSRDVKRLVSNLEQPEHIESEESGISSKISEKIKNLIRRNG